MSTMHRAASAALVGAALAVSSVQLAAPVAAATLPNVGVQSYAYGSYALVGSTVKSGPVAYAGIGCTTSFGRTVKGSAAAVNAAPLGTVGATTTSTASAVENGLKVSRTTASTGAVNLLGGLVRASAVTSASTASVNGVGTFTGANRSDLAGLVVAGRAQSATPAPNTALSLRGSDGVAYATVYLNRQTKTWVGSEWRVQTTALQVVVSGKNPLNVPIGSNVLVGVSSSSLTKPVVGLVGGKGYATSANAADGRVLSSPTALAQPFCAGSSSSATVAAAAVPGVVTTGTTTTTADATATAISRTVRVVDRISGPSVLAGLLGATTIVADTSATQSVPGGPVTLTDRSSFVGLGIKGLPGITASVPPNTVVTVPGLGKVTLHKVTRTAKSIEVVMVEVVTDRVLGSLPTGSVVRIGYSYSAVV
jgi:hypothetical protein